MISLKDLIDINSAICMDVGQESVIINKNNLLSALSVQQWYDDPELLASALIRSLTIGHGFQDGNKRTAAVVGMMIKDFNCSEDTMIDCILQIATGQLKDATEIASILYSEKE